MIPGRICTAVASSTSRVSYPSAYQSRIGKSYNLPDRLSSYPQSLLCSGFSPPSHGPSRTQTSLELFVSYVSLIKRKPLTVIGVIRTLDMRWDLPFCRQRVDRSKGSCEFVASHVGRESCTFCHKLPLLSIYRAIRTLFFCLSCYLHDIVDELVRPLHR